jgi:hypothetical protein
MSVVRLKNHPIYVVPYKKNNLSYIKNTTQNHVYVYSSFLMFKLIVSIDKTFKR